MIDEGAERMSDEKWLTVSDLAEQFGIPQPTIRRYIERHGHHLRTKKHHKSYLIFQESIPYLVRIREGYSEGMNGDQVETMLAASGAPTIITVSDASDHSHERMSLNLDKALSGLGQSVIDGFNKQEEFNRKLIESLTELMLNQKETAVALPDAVQLRSERLNERITERRIERQLEREALDLWAAKPEAERMKKVGLFRKEEDMTARDRFVRDYIDEHYEDRVRGEYDL